MFAGPLGRSTFTPPKSSFDSPLYGLVSLRRSHLGEVLAHVRGEVALPCRIVDDPAAEHILALRKRLKLSRQKFADRFGLDARAVQDWEQGRRVPDRAARVLLTVIDRDPEAVVRVLSK